MPPLPWHASWPPPLLPLPASWQAPSGQSGASSAPALGCCPDLTVPGMPGSPHLTKYKYMHTDQSQCHCSLTSKVERTWSNALTKKGDENQLLLIIEGPLLKGLQQAIEQCIHVTKFDTDSRYAPSWNGPCSQGRMKSCNTKAPASSA